MGTVKVTIDGEEHEVDASQVETGDDIRLIGSDEVPDGMVTQETMNAKMKERLKDERRRIVNGEGERGEEIHQKVLNKAGVPLDEDGNPKLPDDPDFDPDAERERIKSVVIENEVEPVKEENKQLRERNQQLLQTRKRSEILSAAQRHNVADEFVNSVSEAAVPPIVQIVSPSVGYDDEHDQFAVLGEDGFKNSSKQGKAWADMDELFEQMKSDDRYRHLFKDTRPGESGVGDTEGATGSKTTVTMEDLAKGRVDPSAVLKDEVDIES